MPNSRTQALEAYKTSLLENYKNQIIQIRQKQVYLTRDTLIINAMSKTELKKELQRLNNQVEIIVDYISLANSVEA